MDDLNDKLQQQFNGVSTTPFLWNNSSSIPLKQFNFETQITKSYQPNNHPHQLRLGKQVESFIEQLLENDNSIEIIAKNLQIFEQKRTIGEIDLIVNFNNKPVHIEIIYKFYLYNSTVGNTYLEHWIGPNNNDSLVHKLDKLTNKQLPLLHKVETKPYLDNLNLKPNEIEQYVYFKAQLFVPYKSSNIIHSDINTNCIIGEYIRRINLSDFKNSAFYIPSKLDWLIHPTDSVFWMNYEEFTKNINPSILEQRALLFWLKNPDNSIRKMFLYFDE